MTDHGNDYLPYAASALTGVVVYAAIVLATEVNEAWDASIYYSVGIPVMCLAVFAISYVFPRRAWRWTLTMAVAQLAMALLGGSSLSLWPIALVYMMILFLPQLAVGFLGSHLARMRRRT